jgi:hypothetical protein
MDTTNNPAASSTSPRGSLPENQFHTLTGDIQPANPRPTLGREATQGGFADGLYPSLPWTAEPPNMQMPTPSTIESTPPFSRTFQTDNTSTLGGASHQPSSSGYQLHTPTGAGQPTSHCPAPGSEAVQSSLAYGYEGFPWTAEPQNISLPTPSTPGLTPSLSRTFDTSNISTPGSTSGNRLTKASKSTLTGAGQPAASPHPHSGGEQPQSRPHLSSRFSEYMAMLLALDKISVGLSPILLINELIFVSHRY